MDEMGADQLLRHVLGHASTLDTAEAHPVTSTPMNTGRRRR
jgi:hypothetical protein